MKTRLQTSMVQGQHSKTGPTGMQRAAEKPPVRAERDTGVLTTPASLHDSEFDWKQEASRRLAEYRRLTGQRRVEDEVRPHDSGESIALEENPRFIQPIEASTAAQAAARVTERFAQAPRYFELPAANLGHAGRASAAIAQAALKAKTVPPSQTEETAPVADCALSTATSAEISMADLVSVAAPSRNSEAPLSTATEIASVAHEILWNAELPTRVPAQVAFPQEDWLRQAELEELAELEEMEQSLQVIEPTQPIHANLIAFPRELVATRRVRPRLAEGPFALADDSESQLSIFEVEPGAISIEPDAPVSITIEALPDWSAIQLDSHPADELVPVTAAELEGAFLYPATFALRSIAAAIDGALAATAFLIALAFAGSVVVRLSHSHFALLYAALALAATGLAYQAAFFTLSDATPGMRYTGISLCTFDGQIPTRAQLRRRLAALLLSLLPVGFGLFWALFDEDRLSWHDRLSRTYQRQG